MECSLHRISKQTVLVKKNITLANKTTHQTTIL